MSISVSQASAAVRTALSGKTLALFRRICRYSKEVTTIYELPLTPAEVRHLVSLHFRANSSVTDPRIIEMLLIRAELEVDETMNQWKQRAQLLTLLKPHSLPLSPVEDFSQQQEEDDQAIIDALINGTEPRSGGFLRGYERQWKPAKIDS